MSMRDHYRTRAEEFHARAHNESDETVRREYENLAKQFVHLAKEADRDADRQTGYESLPPKIRREA